MTKRDGQNKTGVALVIVLGMLALMMLVSVAFSVYMRTERMAAGNHIHDVRVRLLLYAAMNRAIAGIDDMIPPGVTSIESVPGWANGMYIGTTNVSYFTNVWFNTNDCFRKYIPGVMTGALSASVSFGPFSVTNTRYSYLALDCSGLLDANYAGGTNHVFGTNVHELQIGHLPEIPSPVSLGNFFFARDNWFKRFESLEDIEALATNPAVDFTSLPDLFMYYSRFSKPSNMIDVGGSVTNLMSNRVNITAGFYNALNLDPYVYGRQAYRSGVLFTNLIDYVDWDPMPGNLGNTSGTAVVDGPYVDSFPMLNEILVTNRFRFVPVPGATNLQGLFTVFAEFYQPSTNMGSPFSLGYHFDVIAPSNITYLPAELTNYTVLTPNPGSQYRVWNSGLIHTFAAPNVSLPTDMTVKLSGRMWVDWLGKNVDLTTNISLTLPLPNPTFPTIPLNVVVNSSGGMQCRDPRVNWNGGNPTQWRTNAPPALRESLMNLPNDNPYMTMSMTPINDGDLKFYVANRPLLVPGELGYLFMDDMYPLQTLRLFMHLNNPLTIHPVLDTFVVADDPTKNCWKGRINIQTPYTNVLAAVFTNMVLDYPHGPGVVPISNLTAVVNAILATNRSATFRNLSDLGRINWKTILGGLSEADCEGVLRNASGLLSTRQQLFLILIQVEATRAVWHTGSAASGGGSTYYRVLGGSRAVALLWRDPYPDPVSGKNHWMVRDFKIVERY